MKEKLIKVDFLVEEIVFENEKTCFAVLSGKNKNSSFIAVGSLFGSFKGEILTLIGNYVYNKIYGKQFKVMNFMKKLPTTKKAIINFLIASNIKGLKEKTAEKIVERFGINSLSVLENNPEKLCEIKGIGSSFVENIKKDIKQLFALKHLELFLQKFNINIKTVLKIWNEWGVFSLDKIKKNPYCITNKDIGVSFFIAEKIANTQNVEKNNKNRILAAIKTILSHNALENGHSCVLKKTLVNLTSKLLNVEEETIEKNLEYFIEKSILYKYILKKEFVFLPTYYIAERYIATKLVELSKLKEKINEKDFKNLITLQQEEMKIKFNKTQQHAIKKAIENSVFILTGGPGTGKTTILTAVVSILEQSGLKVAICAPSGKAAKRLEIITQKKATTIHRLLGIQQLDENKKKFVHSQKNRLKFDAVIVDEMSMVDCLIFFNLLNALKENCRIILSGDFNQLPCIGVGNILKHLLSSSILENVKLKSIFRQSKKSLIITNAHNIINEQKLIYNIKGKDFFFIERNSPLAVSKTITNVIKNKFLKLFKENINQNLQLISPCKKGIVGTIELNKNLQKILNPKTNTKKEFVYGFYTFREGDKLLQIKNNYDIYWEKDDEKGEGIFNGEIGKILKIDNNKESFLVDFDGKIAKLSFELAKDLEPAWAITVHKSQGSEFPVVIMPVFFNNNSFFNRNLLYTAITRAKNLILLVGNKKSLDFMCKQKKVNYRYSLLKEFISLENEKLKH